MKFYNPFKPHVVRDGNGIYYVRKLGLGWLYFNGKDWNWKGPRAEPYQSFAEAKEMIELYKDHIKRLKLLEKLNNTVKVVHD